MHCNMHHGAMDDGVAWKGLVIAVGDRETGLSGEDGTIAVTAQTLDGEVVWKTPIQAVSSRSLMAFGGRPSPCGELVVVTTAGEHRRGASIHHQMLHAIDREGVCRWTIELDSTQVVAAADDGIVVLARGPRTACPVGTPPWEVVVLRPASGEVHRRWPLVPSQEAQEALARRRASTRAEWSLEDDGRLSVHMAVWLQGPGVMDPSQRQDVHLVLPYPAPQAIRDVIERP